ncbi:C-C motif chemokine 3-like [Lepisosteus oculatus]|uniref:C-C motif chemokine 3-like n=1 Tax=Lepisosteus oculatus TaxID=7918 RepID=UPI0003EAC3C2|nr:PREDICTED: C-C motif chemokine 3-like [Lepisosteus oculatus]
MSSLRLAVLTLTVVLLFAVSLTEGFRIANAPKKCCFDFTSKEIPIKRISSYSRTSPQCTNPGILFKTKFGRQVCARPTESWVQSHIKVLSSK